MKKCPYAENYLAPTEEEQGELCFRGRHVMMGYLANPELGNGISSEKSFINIGYGNLRADRSVCFLERVFLCYIPSFGI